jgi:hypothetical protein
MRDTPALALPLGVRRPHSHNPLGVCDSHDRTSTSSPDPPASSRFPPSPSPPGARAQIVGPPAAYQQRTVVIDDHAARVLQHWATDGRDPRAPSGREEARRRVIAANASTARQILRGDRRRHRRPSTDPRRGLRTPKPAATPASCSCSPTTMPLVASESDGGRRRSRRWKWRSSSYHCRPMSPRACGRRRSGRR